MTAVAWPSNSAPHSEQRCCRASLRRSCSAAISSTDRDGRRDIGDGNPSRCRSLYRRRDSAARSIRHESQ
jgi:hypothetical protein